MFGLILILQLVSLVLQLISSQGKGYGFISGAAATHEIGFDYSKKSKVKIPVQMKQNQSQPDHVLLLYVPVDKVRVGEYDVERAPALAEHVVLGGREHVGPAARHLVA